jgi:hypothetical protein
MEILVLSVIGVLVTAFCFWIATRESNTTDKHDDSQKRLA